jgi:hypothetical protein
VKNRIRAICWQPPRPAATFLLNAYDALTLASILEETPLKASIKDIGGVYAAISCPPLRQEPCVAARLERQLDDLPQVC